MDDTIAGRPGPDRGDGDPWLTSLCGSRGLRVVGPARIGPDAFTVIESSTLHDMDLWTLDSPSLGAAALDRFKSLAPVMAWHGHPHILAILDAGIHEGRPYLLMKRFAGSTLGERSRGGPLPVAEAVDLAISLARAVHFLHEAGLVQLDLIANRVLLHGTKGPLLDPRRTLERRIVEEGGDWVHGGIAGCEAPEMILGEAVGRETDVYALGALLFQMLTGRAALIRGASGPQAIRNILDLEPERPGSINGDVDRALDSICLRCLAKDPKRRFASAEALAHELERWRSGDGRTGPIGRL